MRSLSVSRKIIDFVDGRCYINSFICNSLTQSLDSENEAGFRATTGQFDVDLTEVGGYPGDESDKSFIFLVDPRRGWGAYGDRDTHGRREA